MHLKAIFLIFVFLFSFSFSLSLADNVGYVDAKFCDGGELQDELNVVTKAGEKNTICVRFSNSRDRDIKIHVGFTNATVTTDTIQNRACTDLPVAGINFSDFLEAYDSYITVSAGESVEKTFALVFAPGYEGFAYGCFVYQLANPLGEINIDNPVFDVIVRKAKFISFYVGDVRPDTNLVIDPTLMSASNNGYLAGTFGVRNNGNVKHIVTISGSVYNVFGYERTFSFDTFVSDPESIHNFSLSDLTDQIALPTYGGLFTVALSVEYNPEMQFDLRKKDQQVSGSGVLFEKSFFMIWSWWVFVSLIPLFVFLYILVLIKRSLFSFLRKKGILHRFGNHKL